MEQMPPSSINRKKEKNQIKIDIETDNFDNVSG
jgi:hypothetical protein